MRHIAEGSAVDVPIHKVVTEELCMVKRVKRLEPEFERFRLRHPGELVNSNVVVGHPRRVKESPRRSARSSELVGTEQGGVEIGLAVAWILIDMEVARNHVGKIDTDSVDSVVLHAQQGVVSEAGECDRQTRRQASDS